MIAQHICFQCLAKQVQTLCDMLHLQEHAHIMKNVCEVIESHRQSALFPPQIAIDVYSTFAKLTGRKDPFYEIKRESMMKAHRIVENLLRFYPPPPLHTHKDVKKMPHKVADSEVFTESLAMLESAQNTHCYVDSKLDAKDTFIESRRDSIKDRLSWAIKIAILGNVIDYGAQQQFDFESADFDINGLCFGAFALDDLIARLESSRTLLYLADNAGENMFDKVLIENIKNIYPHIDIYYGVRGMPIINDLTMRDMAHPIAQDICDYCTLLDTGVRSPGFVYADASPKAQELYHRADTIIAKGMGNFECLNTQQDSRLFMLFKVKCDVVAAFCGVKKGTMMFMNAQSTQNGHI